MSDVNLNLLLKAVHLYGVILWVGGVFVVGVMARQVGDVEGDKLAVSRVGRGAMLQAGGVGLVLAWLGGLSLFMLQLQVFRSAHWLHAKITIALVVSGLTGVISGKLRRAAAGDAPLDAAKISMLSRVMMLLAMIVVGLAVFKPGF